MSENLYHRPIRICYLNTEPRLMDPHKLHIEEKIRYIGDVKIVNISSIDDPELHPCDLLLITAEQIPEEEFYRWMSTFSKRIHKQANMMIPTVVFSEVSFDTQRQFLIDAMKENWYFDIISTKHLDTLPIRITNLLRIHDHIHEIYRYQKTLNELQDKVDILSHKLGIE